MPPDTSASATVLRDPVAPTSVAPASVAPASVAPASVAPASVVDVADLSVRFVNRDIDLQVVEGVSFSLAAGEVLCLLGESGSGKTVTMRALLRPVAAPRADRRARPLGRTRRPGNERAATGGGARSGRGDDLPGADDRAGPGLHHRHPDRRDDRLARGRVLVRGPQARAGPAGDGADPPPPRAVWTPIRTSCPAGCGSAR